MKYDFRQKSSALALSLSGQTGNSGRYAIAHLSAPKSAKNSTEAKYMADLLNLLMLICASVGSLAFGVLTAYGFFRGAFALMRPQRRISQVKRTPETANVI